ncbi:MAG: hypothetical protein O7D95_02900 [Betaproteobacteria bacterium]|nr:hypothetical protein [Betaproteobacteria bacterium]
MTEQTYTIKEFEQALFKHSNPLPGCHNQAVDFNAVMMELTKSKWQPEVGNYYMYPDDYNVDEDKIIWKIIKHYKGGQPSPNARPLNQTEVGPDWVPKGSLVGSEWIPKDSMQWAVDYIKEAANSGFRFEREKAQSLIDKHQGDG